MPSGQYEKTDNRVGQEMECFTTYMYAQRINFVPKHGPFIELGFINTCGRKFNRTPEGRPFHTPCKTCERFCSECDFVFGREISNNKDLVRNLNAWDVVKYVREQRRKFLPCYDIFPDSPEWDVFYKKLRDSGMLGGERVVPQVQGSLDLRHTAERALAAITGGVNLSPVKEEDEDVPF